MKISTIILNLISTCPFRFWGMVALKYQPKSPRHFAFRAYLLLLVSDIRKEGECLITGSKKQMKAGRRLKPEHDEAQSPSFSHVFYNETIRNSAVADLSTQTMINYAVLHFCPFTERPRSHACMMNCFCCVVVEKTTNIKTSFFTQAWVKNRTVCKV